MGSSSLFRGEKLERDLILAATADVDLPVAKLIRIPAGVGTPEILARQHGGVFVIRAEHNSGRSKMMRLRHVFEPGFVAVAQFRDDFRMRSGDISPLGRIRRKIVQFGAIYQLVALS